MGSLNDSCPPKALFLGDAWDIWEADKDVTLQSSEQLWMIKNDKMILIGKEQPRESFIFFKFLREIDSLPLLPP